MKFELICEYILHDLSCLTHVMYMELWDKYFNIFYCVSFYYKKAHFH